MASEGKKVLDRMEADAESALRTTSEHFASFEDAAVQLHEQARNVIKLVRVLRSVRNEKVNA